MAKQNNVWIWIIVGILVVLFLPKISTQTTCQSGADTNIDGIVDRTELGAYIEKWKTGIITRSKLSQAIQEWIDGCGSDGTPSDGFSAGVRCTLWGEVQQEETPAWWVGATQFVSNKFSANPSIIYGIGGIIDEPVGYTYINFPSPGGTHPNVEFSWSGQDENEAYLDALDAAGIDCWLQVEPARADVEDLIELIFDQYGHHSCIMGFGVDVEWLDAPTYPEGRKVTDAEVIAWRNKVKSYDSSYKLFLKHWEISMMPNNYPSDVMFLDDSLGHSSLNSMVNEFSSWGNAFSDAEVGFQVGYQEDKSWWDDYNDPVQKIGDDLASQIPNMEYYYWVDFSIRDVYSSSTFSILKNLFR